MEWNWFTDWVSPTEIANATYEYESREGKWEAVIWKYQDDVWYAVLSTPKIVGIVTPSFFTHPLNGFRGVKAAQEAVESVGDAFPTGGVSPGDYLEIEGKYRFTVLATR